MNKPLHPKGTALEHDIEALGYDPAECDAFKGQNAKNLWRSGKDAWNAAVERFPVADVNFDDVDITRDQKGHRTVSFERFNFPRGRVSFRRASFGNGKVSFNGAAFGDGDVSFDHVMFGAEGVSLSGASFGDGDISFDHTMFGHGAVSFDHVVFGNGNVSFRDAVLGDGDVYFNHITFGDGDLSFKNAKFGVGDVFFNHARFSKGELSFQGTTFNAGDLSFYRTAFGVGDVSFNEAAFGAGEVSFTDAVFGDGDVGFYGTSLGDGDVSFYGTRFGSGDVHFHNAKFGSGDVSFIHTNFGAGAVSFHGTEFGDGDVSFHNAKFGAGRVSFHGAHFGDGEIAFDYATFSNGNIYFYNAVFGIGDVSFHGTTFADGDVSFHNAAFGDGAVSFIHAIFGVGKVSFDNTTFSDGDVSFLDAVFSKGGVFFDNAKFGNGDVSFDNAALGDGDVSFSGTRFADGDVSFTGTIFGEGQLTFDKLSLKRTRFSINPQTVPTERLLFYAEDNSIFSLSINDSVWNKPIYIKTERTGRCEFLSLVGNTFNAVIHLDLNVGSIPDLRRTKFNAHFDLSGLYFPDTEPHPPRLFGRPGMLQWYAAPQTRRLLVLWMVMTWLFSTFSYLPFANGILGIIALLWLFTTIQKHWRGAFFQFPYGNTQYDTDDDRQDGVKRSDLYRRLKDIAFSEKDYDRAQRFQRLELQHRRWQTEQDTQTGKLRYSQSAFTNYIDYVYDVVADYGHSFTRPLITLMKLTGVLFVIYTILFIQLPTHADKQDLMTPKDALLNAAYTTAANTVPFNPISREIRNIDFEQNIGLTGYSLPRQVIVVLGYVHNITALILLFLVGLGLRNRFRL